MKVHIVVILSSAIQQVTNKKGHVLHHVIMPNCGFSRRYLRDALDGYKINNRLGQVIVRAFESSGNFESIKFLQKAIKDRQLYLTDQQGSRDRENPDAEPLNNTHAGPSWSTPKETSNGLPAAQEDWDQEASTSLYVLITCPGYKVSTLRYTMYYYTVWYTVQQTKMELYWY